MSPAAAITGSAVASAVPRPTATSAVAAAVATRRAALVTVPPSARARPRRSGTRPTVSMRASGCPRGDDPVRRASADRRRVEVVERRKAGCRQRGRGRAREVDRAEDKVICVRGRDRRRGRRGGRGIALAGKRIHGLSRAPPRSTRRRWRSPGRQPRGSPSRPPQGRRPCCATSRRAYSSRRAGPPGQASTVPGRVGDSRDLRRRSRLDGNRSRQARYRPPTQLGP